MHAADRDGIGEMGLERGELRPVERDRLDPVGLQLLDFGENRLAAALGAERLDPAALAQQGARAGRAGEGLVLGDAARGERPQGLGAFQPRLWRRGEKIAPDPRRNGGQSAVANFRARIAVERRPEDFQRAARKRIGKNRLALDDAGIAIAGLAGDRAAIEDDDVAPARLQMQRGGNADHPRAQHDHIRFHHRAYGRFSFDQHAVRFPHASLHAESVPPRLPTDA